jgi:hypothetical protein
MTVIAFDTHAAANRFKRAGFTEDQVEALVEITRETTSLPDISTLATKSDIQRLEAKIETEIAGVETRMGRLEAKIDTEIAGIGTRIGRLEAKIDTEIAGVRTEIAGLGAKIASAQVQALTIIISSMAVIVTVATVLSRLIR